MAAATTPQPFWTSYTFWVLSLGLLFNLGKWSGKLPIAFTSNQTEIVNTLLGILGIFFRWRADQPLTTNPAAVALPPAGSGDH